MTDENTGVCNQVMKTQVDKNRELFRPRPTSVPGGREARGKGARSRKGFSPYSGPVVSWVGELCEGRKQSDLQCIYVK